MKRAIILILCVIGILDANAQLKYDNDKIKTGAEQTERYLPKLKGKRVAIVANQTAIIGNSHLVDSLQKLGVNIVKVFGPEHGFRGNASAGIKVKDEIDVQSGLKIVSLYGSKKKPSKEDLKDVDLILFDIQDVGCRFYTIMNTMRDVMEASAENGKPFMILDRPNPNAYFIDGPILDMKHKSGIGQFPIPIVHGMTLGEFALMINGEGWMANKIKCDVEVIKVKGYNHDMLYRLPVNPSPNLNTAQSILLYPSTCLFEGIALNHGRGTMYPFTVVGGPMLKNKYTFSYTPYSIPGMAEDPLFKDQVCYGLDLRDIDLEKIVMSKKINLSWMIDLYKNHPNKEKFFDRSLSKQIGNIDNLIGYADFKKQIAEGWTEEQIRKTWEPGINEFKKIRQKYLLYP
ncbi:MULTISPECIES: exo-beta-N-acetylmuramidase NamZ domain-containing protein [Sphingobacterium]|uniref:DUF1343 domain-containing protein n=1 Tax=Sphingobacterium litopenaei TaxID=2763500 RepID=A0ABR7YI94_9SPHI|nr:MULTISPECIES: DUF1343 domain-containing protein [Sphingobacterium]MBD1431040.1 DUF1343 domain-containing protein [Sphingobacterium litopenaei]NGM73693.1 DUF1343 domain-containing protein [Sphingobacterium sp. SGL-16]